MKPKDIDAVLTKYNKEILAERKKYPNRYPKPLSPNYVFSIAEGFRLYEGTEEQLANLAKRWMPEIQMKYVGIFESVDLFEGLASA